MARDPLREWESFGRVDPYYGVITLEPYRKKNLSEEALRSFFASGERHVESLFESIRRRLDPEFAPRRALDFGCGVGRLTLPLARRSESVLGLDVSESMLQLARKHAESEGRSNVEFRRSDGLLGGVDGEFDFIHSYIVLQHIPGRRGERLFRELLTRLGNGGVGALHLTFYRKLPRLKLLVNWMQKSVPLVQNLVNLRRGRAWGYPHMEMNRYDLNELFVGLFEANCRQVCVEFTDHGGHIGVFLLFRKSGESRVVPHLSFDESPAARCGNQGEGDLWFTRKP